MLGDIVRDGGRNLGWGLEDWTPSNVDVFSRQLL